MTNINPDPLTKASEKGTNNEKNNLSQLSGSAAGYPCDLFITFWTKTLESHTKRHLCGQPVDVVDIIVVVVTTVVVLAVVAIVVAVVAGAAVATGCGASVTCG